MCRGVFIPCPFIAECAHQSEPFFRGGRYNYSPVVDCMPAAIIDVVHKCTTSTIPHVSLVAVHNITISLFPTTSLNLNHCMPSYLRNSASRAADGRQRQRRQPHTRAAKRDATAAAHHSTTIAAIRRRPAAATAVTVRQTCRHIGQPQRQSCKTLGWQLGRRRATPTTTAALP